MGDSGRGGLAEELDLLEFISEDDVNARALKKTGTLDLLKGHIKEQGGSAGLANWVLLKGDKDGEIAFSGTFWWFSIDQEAKKGRTNVKEYLS